MSNVLETPRLALRCLAPGDAAFILELLNDPSWLRFIGDKNVKSLDDARRYIEQGPMKMYVERGFGLWLVERKIDRAPLGICGLVKREQLQDVDLGFAFLPRYWSRGYGRESAKGVLDYARGAVRLKRVVAITSPDNHASARLLEKLGFAHEATLDWGRSAPVELYAWQGPA